MVSHYHQLVVAKQMTMATNNGILFNYCAPLFMGERFFSVCVHYYDDNSMTVYSPAFELICVCVCVCVVLKKANNLTTPD